jgi:hypothetical protein
MPSRASGKRYPDYETGQRRTMAECLRMDTIQQEAEVSGARAIFPYVLILCACIAGVVAYFIPASFWSAEKRDLSVAFYAGVLTFNGLTLALGWTAFSRIYDVLLRGDFGKYLMKNDLLNDYILQITFMHVFGASYHLPRNVSRSTS